MKYRTNKTIPALLAGVALLAAHANAAIVYNFDADEQGWTNVQVSTTNSTAFESDTNTQSNRIDQQYPGDGSLRPTVFGSRDAQHSVALWMRSPAFSLESGHPSMEISFGLIGGTHGSAPANDSATTLTTPSTGSGWLGMALRRVSDGAFILTGARSGSGQDTHQMITWDSTAITAAISGDAATETYTLDMIDSYSGGWGWIGADDVTIVVPEPSSAILLVGLMAPAMLLRRRRN